MRAYKESSFSVSLNSSESMIWRICSSMVIGLIVFSVRNKDALVTRCQKREPGNLAEKVLADKADEHDSYRVLADVMGLNRALPNFQDGYKAFVRENKLE
jgi:hypothetical protein